ncbi:hypothetical protein C0075_24260, partial [Rhizobium sp. KAs_5_22]
FVILTPFNLFLIDLNHHNKQPYFLIKIFQIYFQFLRLYQIFFLLIQMIYFCLLLHSTLKQIDYLN